MFRINEPSPTSYVHSTVTSLKYNRSTPPSCPASAQTAKIYDFTRLNAPRRRGEWREEGKLLVYDTTRHGGIPLLIGDVCARISRGMARGLAPERSGLQTPGPVRVRVLTCATSNTPWKLCSVGISACTTLSKWLPKS